MPYCRVDKHQVIDRNNTQTELGEISAHNTSLESSNAQGRSPINKEKSIVDIFGPIFINTGKRPETKSVYRQHKTLTPKSSGLYLAASQRMIEHVMAKANPYSGDVLQKVAERFMTQLNAMLGAKCRLSAHDFAQDLLSNSSAEEKLVEMIRSTEYADLLELSSRLTIRQALRATDDQQILDTDFENFLGLFTDINCLKTGKKTQSGASKPAPTGLAETVRVALETRQSGRFANLLLAHVNLTRTDASGQAHKNKALKLLIKSGEVSARTAPTANRIPVKTRVTGLIAHPLKALDIADKVEVQFKPLTPEVSFNPAHYRNGKPSAELSSEKRDVEICSLRDSFYQILKQHLESDNPATVLLPGQLFKLLGLDASEKRTVARVGTRRVETESENHRLLDTEHMLLTFLKDWHVWLEQDQIRIQHPGFSDKNADPGHEPGLQDPTKLPEWIFALRQPETESRISIDLSFFTYLEPCVSCELGILTSRFSQHFDFLRSIRIWTGRESKLAVSRKPDAVPAPQDEDAQARATVGAIQ